MKTKKNTVKLTEGELKKIISESVKRVLREGNENFLDAELQKIWMGIQRIGGGQGRHIKDEMKIHGFEQLVPKYEMLEKYADKMREILQQIFTEVDSEWAWNRKDTPKFSTPREEEGMGFSTDGIRAF